MEHYGLRAGNDYDLLISKEDFQRLRLQFPDGFFTNTYGDAGLRVGEHEFSCESVRFHLFSA